MKLPSRNRLILLTVLLQLAALGFIAGKREWIYNHGEVVFLRTAPVDPRDMFRGDYVQLSYEIAQPEAHFLQQPWLKAENLYRQKQLPLYLKLQREAGGVATLAGISREPPVGLFLKGEANLNWYYQQNNGFIKLGIDQYFVEQGAGKALEFLQGRGQEWQTPLEMEVAIGPDGTAVIRGHRWSEVGVRIEVTQPAQPQTNNSAPPTRQSPIVTISIRNQSSRTVALLDSAEHCAFQIADNLPQPNGIGQMLNLLETPNRHCNEAVAWQEYRLNPGEVLSFSADLAEPLWHVTAEGKLQELGQLQNRWMGFRFIYQIPGAERTARKNRPDLWLSQLRTARFIATGRVD